MMDLYMVWIWLCHIPTFHHYDIFPPGGYSCLDGYSYCYSYINQFVIVIRTFFMWLLLLLLVLLHIALTPWPPPPPLGLALQSKNSRGTQHCRPHTHPAWWGSLSDEAIKGYTKQTYFVRLWVKSVLYRCFSVQNIESSLISVMFWEEGTNEEHKGRFTQNQTSKLPPEFNLTNDQIWTLNEE